MAAQAQQLIAQANQRLVEATAQTEAVKLGVDPKYIADAVKLCDLSKIAVGEDGSVDANLVSKALDEVLKRVPVFKVTADSAGGFRVGGQGMPAPSANGWGNNQNQSQGQTQGMPAPKSWNRQNRF